MFLIRPRPQFDESLSSWRQRFGMANGFRLFPLAPSELRRSDPDVAPSDSVLNWVSRTHGEPIERVTQMTASAKFGTTLGKSVHGVRRWIVSMQYSRQAHRSYGLPYCPECLREDTHPYFRLHWRYSLHSHCFRHGVLYRDTCFRCNTAAWPSLCVNVRAYENSWAAPHNCCVCGADLRDATSGAVVSDMQMYEPTSVSNSVVSLNEELNVSAKSYGDAVWMVCQLFMRVRSARRIAQHHAVHASLITELHLQQVRSVEELSIQLRHLLTTVTHHLFTQWPNNLASFCSSAEITAEHFSQDRKGCPVWFEDFLQQHLCKQKRGITVKQVLSASEQLKKLGMPATKTNVSELLGVSSSTAIELVFRQRMHATVDETLQFMHGLASLTKAHQNRRSTTAIRLRDSLILLLSILEGMPPAEVQAWSKRKCMAALSNAKNLPDAQGDVAVQCVALINELTSRYEKFRAVRLLTTEDNDQAYFEGFRGVLVPQRSLHRTISTAMKSLDTRLMRSVSVFSSVLGAEKPGAIQRQRCEDARVLPLNSMEMDEAHKSWRIQK
jgi:hypothetical protein